MKNLFLYILLTFSFAVSAQERDKDLPKANEQFASKQYVDAEANYRVSASKFPKKAIASYNLGTAIYKEKQPAESKLAFANAIKKSKLHPEKHNAYHNLGNALMLEKNYEEAVEAYKNALRNNPEDEETRYNYALAKKMKKEHPDKNKDKKKDKDKDKKDDKKDKKDDKKDDKGDKDKDKKEGDGKDKKDDKGEPKEKPGEISKQRLQNLMDAVNNEEKKVQDKVNAQKVKGKPVKTEKDW
jgi:tetratricopeptide (TPR) repeat protein